MIRIGKQFKTAALFMLVAPILGTATAHATVLYSNVSSLGAGYPGSSGNGINIILDDVLVPQSLNPSNQPLAITKVTFGILRAPAAPAVDVTGYWGQLTEPVDSNVDAGGFPIVATPINTIGTQSLSDGPNATILETVSFGNGLDTLFTVNPAFDDSLAQGYGEFAIGLKFSTISSSNQWALEDPSDPNFQANGDFFWGTTGVNTTPTSEQFQANTAVFYMQVEGTPAPEPTAAVLLGASLLGGLICRRRTH